MPHFSQSRCHRKAPEAARPITTKGFDKDLKDVPEFARASPKCGERRSCRCDISPGVDYLGRESGEAGRFRERIMLPEHQG